MLCGQDAATVSAALVLPVIDLSTGEVRATMHLLRFETNRRKQLPPDITLAMALDLTRLTSRAYSERSFWKKPC